jgi:hypothetical protein
LEFFAFDQTLSYDGHFNPILAVQVTELPDGTSLWNFFNTFTEKSRGVKRISKQLDFT